MEIHYTVEALPEDTHPRDSFEDNEELADRIAKDSEWNPWAWFTAKVTASVELEGFSFRGDAYLGGCSYESEEEFMKDVYFDDLKKDARGALVAALKDSAREGKAASAVLTYMGEG